MGKHTVPPFKKESFVFDDVALQNSSVSILVAINEKSGNQLGKSIVKYLKDRYPSLKFIELPAEENSNALDNLTQLPSPRIIVGGGDGTVAWVASRLKGVFDIMPPFALLPIGVGNELSRCVGWGTGFRGSPAARGVLDRFLHQVIHNETNPIDLWKVELSNIDAAVRGAKDGHRSLVCFMSIGFDAAISHSYHQLRETRPTMAKAFPKTAYAIYGAQRLINTPPKLMNLVELTVDDVRVVLPPSIRTIQILNCHSSADGLDFFGRDKKSKVGELMSYSAPSLSDGLVEVVGTEGVGHLLAIRRGSRHSHRLAQGKAITIRILPGSNETLIAQIDGESWVPQGELRISHHTQHSVVLGPGPTRL